MLLLLTNPALFNKAFPMLVITSLVTAPHEIVRKHLMIRFAKKLFLFCMFAAGYRHIPLAACAPRNKPHDFAPMIQVCHAPNEAGAFAGIPETMHPIHRGMEFRSVQPASQSALSQGHGYVQTHTMHPGGKHHGHKSSPVGPTAYRRMQLSGDTAALTSALQDLEKRRAQCSFPRLRGIPRQIKEVKKILNSPEIAYLHGIRTDDLAVAQAKIENLWLAISQGVVEYIPVYDAALAIYVERREQALMQEENERKQAVITQEKKIALAAVAAQKVAAQKEIDQKVACDNPDEQKPIDLMSLEQEKQALLEQAERTPHLFESEELYRQADAVEAQIQALTQGAAAVLKASCDNPDEQKPVDLMSLEQEKQALLEQAERTPHLFESEELYRQANVVEAYIQALGQAAALNNNSPMVIGGGIILPSSLNGLPALPAHEPADYNIDHNSEYAYQFDAIMTHACQTNLAAHPEADEKVAHEIFGLNDNPPMVITDSVTLALGYPSAPLRNYDYEWKMVLSDAYLDNCAADPQFNHKIVDAVCEGLQEAGYAFATKALNPYEALETYKELGQSLASLAKGAFYLTIGRDIYILSGGKYCMSDAELRENIYLVINAIKEFDPSAFSAKQVGEFAGTEAAKMVHTFGLGKIIDVVGKVNMARKARSLVKKLDNVTRAAQAERAVAVTAEGFVVEAAHDVRAGSLAKRGGSILKSEISSGSGRELLCPVTSKARSVATIGRKADILDYIKKPLHDLMQKSKNIKFIRDEVLDVAHTFSRDHVANRVLDMGMTAEQVAAECVKLIDQVDQAGLLVKGINNVRTTINGIPFDVRFFVQNETLMSFNGFVGNSKRLVKSLIIIEGEKIWKAL
jgi:hypothetical protein